MLTVAFLGPAGTYTHEALLAAAGGGELNAVPRQTIHDAIRAVETGEAHRAFVPFENSIEGAVRATLDTLAFETDSVTIAGEHDHPIRHSLIAREQLPLDDVTLVLSHEQAAAQCARFLRESLPAARTRTTPSNAEAVRTVAASTEPWAAIASSAAAGIYGATVLREGVEDEPDNVTRFVWIGPAGTRPGGKGPWRTTLIFSELGEDHPGALVNALTEFSSRAVNLTRIESRPLRRGLGRYMFFVDLDGRGDDPPVAEAIDALRGKAESVRVLGSYPVNAGGVPGAAV